MAIPTHTTLEQTQMNVDQLLSLMETYLGPIVEASIFDTIAYPAPGAPIPKSSGNQQSSGQNAASSSGNSILSGSSGAVHPTTSYGSGYGQHGQHGQVNSTVAGYSSPQEPMKIAHQFKVIIQNHSHLYDIIQEWCSLHIRNAYEIEISNGNVSGETHDFLTFWCSYEDMIEKFASYMGGFHGVGVLKVSNSNIGYI